MQQSPMCVEGLVTAVQTLLYRMGSNERRWGRPCSRVTANLTPMAAFPQPRPQLVPLAAAAPGHRCPFWGRWGWWRRCRRSPLAR